MLNQAEGWGELTPPLRPACAFPRRRASRTRDRPQDAGQPRRQPGAWGRMPAWVSWKSTGGSGSLTARPSRRGRNRARRTVEVERFAENGGVNPPPPKRKDERLHTPPPLTRRRLSGMTEPASARLE